MDPSSRIRSDPPSALPVALEVQGLSKAFGETQALLDASLSFRFGRVHALLGQNGSGKSTLIKILSGYHASDAGTVRIRDTEVTLPMRPDVAAELGLSFVHQDLGLADEATVLENLRAGQYARGWFGRINWRAEAEVAAAALADFGLDDIPLHSAVRNLGEGERAGIAVARALSQMDHARPSVLVLDEPTTHLAAGDVDRLLDTIDATRALGHAVVLVTHRLEEVDRIADDVTVLRQGRVVLSRPTEGLSRASLTEAIVGRVLDDDAATARRRRRNVALSVRRLAAGALCDVSFDVADGEIVGVAGHAPSGYAELPSALFGLVPWRAGEATLDGSRYEPHSPRDAIAAGVALVPADRARRGLVMGATCAENLAVPRDLLRHRLLTSHRGEGRHADKVIHRYAVVTTGPHAPIGELSGGNQQKLLLAKWIEAAPRLLLLNEPAQGVDPGARRDIFALIDELAQRGSVVLMAATDAEDLGRLCHRVLVVHQGRVVDVVERPLSAAHIVARLIDLEHGARPTLSTAWHRRATGQGRSGDRQESGTPPRGRRGQ